MADTPAYLPIDATLVPTTDANVRTSDCFIVLSCRAIVFLRTHGTASSRACARIGPGMARRTRISVSLRTVTSAAERDVTWRRRVQGFARLAELERAPFFVTGAGGTPGLGSAGAAGG